MKRQTEQAKTSNTLTLEKLKHGDRALITRIDMTDAVAAAKLAARGIVPGISIGVVRGGDPLLIGVDEDRWALSSHEAASIHVDVLERPRRSLLRLFSRS